MSHKLGKYGHLKEFLRYIKTHSVLGRTKNTTFSLTITLFIHVRYNLKLIVNKVQYSFEQNPTNAHTCRTLKVIWASLPVI
jgi:hypothetical protein